MKITAEFNSNEELMSFINTFNAKTFISGQGTAIPVIPVKDIKPTTDTKKAENPKNEDKKDTKNETPAKDLPVEDKKEDPKVEEKMITKEMVRAIFTTFIKAGMQTQAKTLTAKYGASKIPEIKEKDYAAIFNEANALLEAK
jgi:hypothetical protein